MTIKNNIGVCVPEILIPNSSIDLKKWSVVACDQYTSQEEYWNNVEKLVGAEPSTLHIVFPEVYLEQAGKEKRIENISKAMKEYQKNVLVSCGRGFMIVKRTTSHSGTRNGLIVALDLEEYDYNKGSQTLIRATEGTVLDRIPPRVQVREKASIECPHIMILIDDPEKTVIEPLTNEIDNFKKQYDFDLMMDGGHISGYFVDDLTMIKKTICSLENLASQELFYNKYGVSKEKGVLLFAVGDGNHSLATAKACWEDIKNTLAPEEIHNHPARYALVELVNVHDDGLIFEPIHRVVFNVDPMNLLDEMIHYFNELGSPSTYEIFSSRENMANKLTSINSDNTQKFSFVYKDIFGIFTISNPQCNLEVGCLQMFLDSFVNNNPKSKVDYIHGEDVVTDLGTRPGNIGFFLPPMDKHELFKTVIIDGALPRKTFSMGEAEEKRFYLECRNIVKD